MTFFAQALDLLKNLAALLAVALPATWALWVKARSRWGYVSWRRIESRVQRLHEKMLAATFRPACIVGIGRAGGIVGSLLSERFGPPLVPVVILSFEYPMQESAGLNRHFALRVPQPVELTTITEEANDVLVMGIDVFTGATMKQSVEHLKGKGISIAGTACLFWNPDALLKPTFYVDHCAVRMKFPWNLQTFRERYGFG